MNTNYIDFGFFDSSNSKLYAYNILVILNKPSKEILTNLRCKANYVIITNGCSDEIYDFYGAQFLPDCVMGDIESIREDIKLSYVNKRIKFILKNNSETTDLEKTMYYCLEKFHDKTNWECQVNGSYEKKELKRCMMIYLDTDCGFENILSTPSDIYKYYIQYQQEMNNIDIYLFSEYSVSIFLKDEVNEITSSMFFENKKFGYSIISLCGEALITVHEEPKEKQKEYIPVTNKTIKFGSSFFFRKTEIPHKIIIEVKVVSQCCLIFSTTCKYLDF